MPNQYECDLYCSLLKISGIFLTSYDIRHGKTKSGSIVVITAHTAFSVHSLDPSCDGSGPLAKS